ncbi:thioredoxin [Acinetobacter phage Herod]|nr:thioredoxin [Acinetobacter phage Herod]
MYLELVENEAFSQIGTNRKVIFKFGAKWCSGCKAITPVLKKLSEQNPDIVFVDIDIEQSKELAERFNVQTLPTFISFQESLKKDTIVGTPKITQLKEMITNMQK